MSIASNTGPDVTIDDSTFNSVNSTSGGAIIQFHGTPTTTDYEFIVKLAATCSQGQTGMMGRGL